MHRWISTQYRVNPWLAAGLAVYLLLSAVEAARYVIVAAPPDAADLGFSPWQEAPSVDGEGNAIPFRLAAHRSVMARPVRAPVLGLTLVRRANGAAATARPVSFSIDGRELDAYSLPGDGDYSFRYYLPSILGAEKWSAIEDTLPRADPAVSKADRWPGVWAELNPWHRPAVPPAIRIETSIGSAFSPKAAVVTRAQDEPTDVGIASVEWLEELPLSGAGFHDTETGDDDVEYRWTRRWAALPLDVRGREAVVRVRALHPAVEQRPVTVDLYWNATLRRTISLSSSAWTDVAVPVPGSSREGVLSLRVSRTWSPARIGSSGDVRELGVAFAGVAWR